MTNRPAATKAPANTRPKLPKAPATLPKQFDAALLDTPAEDLRAYLRDLAARQRATRADFLLWRAAQTSASGGPDRAAVLATIRLGLKQLPKLPRRGWHDEPVTPAGKRLLRLREIAAALLPAARRHLADRSDLPAVRATGLALLEAELTELPPDLNWNSFVAHPPHPDAVEVLRELWAAYPAAEARALLWAELRAVGTAGPGDAPAHLALLNLLDALAPTHPDGSATAYRSALALADDLLRRQPAPPPAPPARPRHHPYEYSPHDAADGAINSERSRLSGHRDKLRLLRLLLHGRLHPAAAAAELLADLHPDFPSKPLLRAEAADTLLTLGRPLDARALLEEGLAALPANALNWQRGFKERLLKVEQALPKTAAGAAESAAAADHPPADPTRARALARELLFEHDFDDDGDALRALRATYPPAEWPAARAALLTDAAAGLSRRFGRALGAGTATRLAEIDLEWSVIEDDPARTTAALETVPTAPLLLRYHALVPAAAVARLLPAAERLLPAYMAERNNRRDLDRAAELLARLVRHAPATAPTLRALAADLRQRFPRRTMLHEVLDALGV